MRIDRIYIDGFGIFHNLDVNSIPPGMCVLYGENEAGKTTLLSFVRAILFGFPSGRSNQNPYQPLVGGRHGGRIDISVLQGNRYTIERFSGGRGGVLTVTSPDGTVHGEDTLRRLRGLATRDVYNNIFGFSHSELQRLEALDDDTVKATIYGAGLGIRVSLPEIESRLAQEGASLFKSGGQKPVINQTLRELEEVRGQIREKSRDTASYDSLQVSLLRYESQLDGLRIEKKLVRGQNDLACRVLNVWDDWVEYLATAKSLSALSIVESFPRGGLTRLDVLEERLNGLVAEIAGVDAEIDEIKAKRDSIRIKAALLDSAVEIETLVRGREKFESATDDLPRLEAELNTARDEVSGLLKRLGLDWDASRAEAFDDSIPARETIRTFQEQVRSAESEIIRARNRAEQAKLSCDRAKDKLNSARVKLESQPRPAVEDRALLKERALALRQVSVLVLERMRLTDEQTMLADRIADLAAQGGVYEVSQRSARGGTTNWVAIAFIVIAFLFAGALWWVQQRAFSLVLAGLALTAALWFRISVRSMARERREQTGRLAEIRSRESKASQRKLEIVASLESLDKTLGAKCLEAAVAVPHSSPDVDGYIQAVDDQLDVERGWADAKTRVEELTGEVSLCDEELDLANGGLVAAEERLSEVQKERQQWLASVGLPISVSSDGALDMVTKIESVKEARRRVKGLEERIGRIRAYTEKYSDQVIACAKGCGHEHVTTKNPGSVVDALASQLLNERTALHERNGMEEKLALQMKQRHVLASKRDAVEREKKALLDEAEATSVEEFRNMGQTWSERAQLELTCSERRKSIEKIGGVGPSGEEFIEFLRSADLAEQQNRKAETDTRLTELDEEIERVSRLLGEAQEKIRVIESSTETSDLRLNEQSLLEKLHQDSQRWFILALAQHLLAKTRDEYERERQPGVIRDATGFFGPMTGGRYKRIVAVPGESGFQVIDRDDTRKSVDALSSATREQLYFALRLGLIREFCRKQEPLPVVLDDVFVNFDQARQRAAVKAVLNLSRENQVIVFTCHSETIRLVAAENGQIRILAFDPTNSQVHSVSADEWVRSHAVA